MLNATFGNAPELLISIAALRSGYYRVVQLAMLGSMLTNLMLVFGIACIIGGCRYQVQYIRQTSGNVSVVLLLVATAGSLFPAALVLSGQFPNPEGNSQDEPSDQSPRVGSFHVRAANNAPSPEEVTLCRVNAAVMLMLYICYLIFQLGTHKEEFDDNEEQQYRKKTARRNVACQNFSLAITNIIAKSYSMFQRLRFYPSNIHSDGIVYSECSMDESCRESLTIGDKSFHDAKTKNSGERKFSSRRLKIRQGLRNADIESNVVSETEEDEASDYSTETGTEGSCRSIKNVSNRVDVERQRLDQSLRSSSHSVPVSPRHSTAQYRRRRLSGQVSHCSSSGDDTITFDVPPLKTPISTVPRLKSKNSEIALMSDEDSDVDYDDEEDIRLISLHGSDACVEQFLAIPLAQSGGPGMMLDSSIRSERHLRNLSTGTTKSVVILCDPPASSHPLISLRVGIMWLFIITMCISTMSDVLVDTIDGFAQRMNLSEVFTSMVIIPFFSNVAEQVSAFLFAYRNEMDLCVGITVGSAVQIATFILPGSVLIGMFLDRNMTLYFHTFETVCLFFGVIVVAAILQGGSTNWFVGVMLVGVYIMFATGIWYHELEDLDVDLDGVD